MYLNKLNNKKARWFFMRLRILISDFIHLNLKKYVIILQ